MSEELQLSVHQRELEVPLIQGGMGVGVSLERLAGSVAACGAMGCISTADCGYREPDFYKKPICVRCGRKSPTRAIFPVAKVCLQSMPWSQRSNLRML